MKAFRSFDNVTTPERWKQQALDISGFEKPKLKKTYEIAVVAAAAVFAVAVVAVNRFVRFGSTDSPDEDRTPEIIAAVEDEPEDDFVSGTDERYQIVGNSDGSYYMHYGFHNEDLAVNYFEDLENITNERIAKTGYASGVIIRMEKNEEYTTLYLATENPVRVIERDEHVYLVKFYDPEQYAKDRYIEIQNPDNAEIVKARVRNDMLPSDNFEDEGTVGLDEHKFVVYSGAFLFFDKSEAEDDIANGRLPVANKYYLYASTPVFCTQEEYSEIEKLADIVSDFGKDEQLKDDLILGQIMNLDKEKPGFRNRCGNAEKLGDLKAVLGGIAFDPDGDTTYLVEQIVPCALNDTQTTETEGRESETFVFTDGTDFSNAQAVFDGTDSADIMNGGEKLFTVQVISDLGGKVKDIKIVYRVDTTELYVVAAVEGRIRTKDDIKYTTILGKDPTTEILSDRELEALGDRAVYADYEEWQTAYAAGEDISEKALLVRVQRDEFRALLKSKGIEPKTELNSVNAYGVLIYPDILQGLYELHDTEGEEFEPAVTMSFDFTGDE